MLPFLERHLTRKTKQKIYLNVLATKWRVLAMNHVKIHLLKVSIA